MSELTFPFAYPENAIIIPLTSVETEGRGRDDYGDLNSLAEDITSHGLIHPPTVWRKPDGDYVLMAGGRRTAAMRILGCTHIPVSVRSEPLTEHELLEIELVENTGRKNFTWQEEVKLIEKAHTAYTNAHRKTIKNWGTRHTGKLLGKSSSHVSHALLVARELRSGNAEVIKSDSIASAYRILLKQREDLANTIAASRLRDTIKSSNVPKAPIKGLTIPSSLTAVRDATSFDDVFDLDTSIENLFGDDLVARPDSSAVVNFFGGMTDFPLSKWFHHGDTYEWMASLPAESVDHIITDPPYGIDIHDDFMQDKSEIAAEHDREDNIANFPLMIELFYRMLKPDAYCILFFDYEHYELLVSLAKAVGFRVQIHPFIWHKTHTCKNTAPHQNFTKNHEPALILKKGSPTLNSNGIPALISANGQLERKLYTNPFAKPFDVWKALITAVARPGQIVADPFAGQNSCPRALINLGITPLACEKVRNHYDRGLNNVRELIEDLTQKRATFS